MLARTRFSSHKHKSQTSSLMATLVLLLPNLKTPLTIQIAHMQPGKSNSMPNGKEHVNWDCWATAKVFLFFSSKISYYIVTLQYMAILFDLINFPSNFMQEVHHN